MPENQFLRDKTIIIAIPNDFGLPEMFKKNLEFLGMIVYLLPHSENHHKISIIDELKHIGRKIFKKDRSYKNIAKEQNRLRIEQQIHHNLLDSISEEIDFALIIRPDLLNNDIIEKIKGKAKKMVGYQWDGLERYPNIYRKIKYFDSFFVFDHKDLAFDPNFKLITNFYFDFNIEEHLYPKNDVFFIGSHIESRMPKLIEISSFLKKNGFKIDINVIGSSRKYIEKNSESGITHITEIFDFEKNYNKIKNAKAILDLLNNVHNGLSLRTFESIGLKKKLITNNLEVKNYDFYNKDNIFIIGENKTDDISTFLSTPYNDLNFEIYKKYGFTNWICNILETSEYLPIIN